MHEKGKESSLGGGTELKTAAGRNKITSLRSRVIVYA